MSRILIFLLIISSFAFSQGTSQLTNTLNSLRRGFLIPGMSAAIYQKGGLAEKAISGIRKVGFEELIGPQDKFHLGSCTKSMTATVAATLVEEGKLNWNDTLESLLSFKGINSSFKGVTFEMLFAHRTGLIKDTTGKVQIDLENLPTLEARAKLAKIFLTKEPSYKVGSYNYSNIGYIIAAHILELKSGKSWENLIQERLFNPLEMKSCGFGATSTEGEVNPSQPWGHIAENWSIKAIHDDNPPFYAPAANVHCSIEDWSKYLNMHMNGMNKKSKFLRQESFDQLHRVYPVENANYTYGGWYRVHRSWAKGDVLTHTGTNTMNYASVWMAPSIETIMMSTANRSTYSGSMATDKAISEMIKLYIRRP